MGPRTAELDGERRERRAALAAGSLGLLLPFVIFVHHHGYSPWRFEIAAAAGLLIVAGLLLGFALRGTTLRVALAAILVTLFVDLQLDWIDAWWRAGVVAMGTVAIGWPLRRWLGSILAFVSAAMILSTWPLPGGQGWIEGEAPAAQPESRSELPPIIHLVLDEHIGIEGIPPEFDQPDAPSRWLKNLYTERGFWVFGGAFSRYYLSPSSLSYLVNTTAAPEPFRYVRKHSRNGAALLSVTPNGYFEEMAERGYQIHVFQTDYMDYCIGLEDIEFASCRTYVLESIRALENTSLSSRDRLEVVLGMFARLSFVITSAWRQEVGRVSALSTMAAVDELEAQLTSATPGSLHFAHLMLPHYPFAYDRDCALRPSPRDWLTSDDPSSWPRRNSTASRAKRYPLYIDQVVCTQRRIGELFSALETSGVFDDAIILVHGDHGSRIDRGPPNTKFAKKLIPKDYIDGYSTFFAIKLPKGRGGYSPAPLPLDELLEQLILNGRDPAMITLAKDRSVFLTNGVKKMQRRPMPNFAGGRPIP